MNKSTPINHLPGNQMMQNTFINEPQRQMVTNAQQAVGNITPPQNTQNDAGDDDAEIQEALNDVNAQLHQQKPQMQMAPPQPSPQDMAELMGNPYAVPNIPIENHADIAFLQGARYTPQMHMQPPAPMMLPSPPAPTKDWGGISTVINKFAAEIKLALIVASVVAVVHFVPFTSIVEKYIAIDKIPYHDIILRALFAAVAVVTIKNLVS